MVSKRVVPDLGKPIMKTKFECCIPFSFVIDIDAFFLKKFL